VPIKRFEAEKIVSNGIREAGLERLLSEGDVESGFTEGQILVNSEVVLEPSTYNERGGTLREVGRRGRYHLVREEVERGRWVVPGTRGAFDSKLIAKSVEVVSLNGRKVSLIDLAYDGEPFDLDWSETKVQESYVLDPRGNRFSFDFTD
jgi:hypothetical protein